MNNKLRLWLSSRVLHSTTKPRWAAADAGREFCVQPCFREMRDVARNGLSRKHSRSRCRLPRSGSTFRNRLASTKRSSASQHCPTGANLPDPYYLELARAGGRDHRFIDKLYIGINFCLAPQGSWTNSVPQRVWLLRSPRRRIKWPL